MHYDLRLELDGVLISWAVPKGPSLDPAERRLAVHVEDHPFDYGTFEGVIPAGEYGAGEDIVWDNGTYSPDEGGHLSFSNRREAEERVRAELAAGKISFRLRGRKLKGSWTLVKTSADEKSWLLMKHRDAIATAEVDLLAEEASVLTSLTIDDLKAGLRLPEPSGLGLPNPAELPGAKVAAFPRQLTPMLAAQEDRSFADDAWLYEPKLDGIRALAAIRDGQVTLTSRNQLELTGSYPALVAELATQPADALLLDGEIVALQPSGVPSFSRLQQRLGLTDPDEIRRADTEIPVVYYAFDLLYADGIDLRRIRLDTRKELLLRIVDPTPTVQALAPIEAPGEAVYQGLVSARFEGMVAKRRDSRYLAGKRSTSWVKVKRDSTEEFVVAGFTPGKGARATTFGALLLGRRDAEGKLAYSGRLGGGFSNANLREIRDRLDKLTLKRSPFRDDVPDARDATFVKPKLVVEVKFAEWTSERVLRAPVFLRLRNDKGATDVAIAPAVSASTPEADPTAAVLTQLDLPGATQTLEVGGARVELSNLDKELWPALGDRPPVTKRDLLRYYTRISPFLIPQLVNRPLTLTRFPNGIEGKSFYQKRWTQPLPEFVGTVAIFSEDAQADQDYLLCNNLPTLLWLAQLADLTLHVSLARTVAGPDAPDLSERFTRSRAQIERSALNHPDFLLFDLDPFIVAKGKQRAVKNQPTDEWFRKSAAAALWLKEILDGAGLRSFVKTSGSSGLHVFVPIARNLTYDAVRAACQTIAGTLVAAHPKEVTTDFPKEKRVGKVYIDVNQNGRIKNLAAAYSPRANPGAPVSIPLRWDEVGEVDPLSCTLWTAGERVARVGDLWSGILHGKQDLRSLLDG